MDFKNIIKNSYGYINSQQNRGKHVDIVPKMISLYETNNRLNFQNDMLKRLKNLLGQHISTIKKTNSEPSSPLELNDIMVDEIFNYTSHKDTFETAKTLINQFKSVDAIKLSSLASTKINDNKLRFPNINEELNKLCEQLGNLIHPSVPSGRDIVLKEVTNYIQPSAKPMGHYQLCLKTNIINLKDGTSVAGNRGYYLIGNGVKLNRALMSYAIDFIENKNYELYETPHIMTQESLAGVAQLSDFEETLYKCHSETDPKYLIATSEQPLTAMFRNKLLNVNELPIKIAGISHCYRKEAGAHGKDTLGIFRVHQFEKIEQFCITDKDNDWNMMSTMMDISTKFYDSLGISYRVVNVHSEDLNNAAAMKYDLEGYFPGADNKYKELVSCTNCTDYISKKIHCKDNKGNFVHMLNATLCANTRTICCLLETHQTETGIRIPDVLVPYMGGMTEIPYV
jgi:seryl-tRNA synthetase